VRTERSFSDSMTNLGDLQPPVDHHGQQRHGLNLDSDQGTQHPRRLDTGGGALQAERIHADGNQQGFPVYHGAGLQQVD